MIVQVNRIDEVITSVANEGMAFMLEHWSSRFNTNERSHTKSVVLQNGFKKRCKRAAKWVAAAVPNFGCLMLSQAAVCQ